MIKGETLEIARTKSRTTERNFRFVSVVNNLSVIWYDGNYYQEVPMTQTLGACDSCDCLRGIRCFVFMSNNQVCPTVKEGAWFKKIDGKKTFMGV